MIPWCFAEDPEGCEGECKNWVSHECECCTADDDDQPLAHCTCAYTVEEHDCSTCNRDPFPCEKCSRSDCIGCPTYDHLSEHPAVRAE